MSYQVGREGPGSAERTDLVAFHGRCMISGKHCASHPSRPEQTAAPPWNAVSTTQYAVPCRHTHTHTSQRSRSSQAPTARISRVLTPAITPTPNSVNHSFLPSSYASQIGNNPSASPHNPSMITHPLAQAQTCCRGDLNGPDRTCAYDGGCQLRKAGEATRSMVDEGTRCGARWV